MKHLLCALLLCLALPAAAEAGCFVEYKAKQDSPLRLHYGIVELGGGSCPSRDAATAELRKRLGRGGWTLLNVLGMSSETPSEKKKANAGPYYLRY